MSKVESVAKSVYHTDCSDTGYAENNTNNRKT